MATVAASNRLDYLRNNLKSNDPAIKMALKSCRESLDMKMSSRGFFKQLFAELTAEVSKEILLGTTKKVNILSKILIDSLLDIFNHMSALRKASIEASLYHLIKDDNNLIASQLKDYAELSAYKSISLSYSSESTSFRNWVRKNFFKDDYIRRIKNGYNNLFIMKLKRFKKNHPKGLTFKKSKSNAELHNFNNNRPLSGWESKTVKGGKIENGKMWGKVRDGRVNISKDISGINSKSFVFEWDGNLKKSYWGVANVITITTESGDRYQVALGIATYNYGNKNYIRFRLPGQGWRDAKTHLLKMEQANFHYKATFEDGSVRVIATRISNNTEKYNISGALTGMILKNIKKVSIAVGATTGNNVWMDNVLFKVN